VVSGALVVELVTAAVTATAVSATEVVGATDSAVSVFAAGGGLTVNVSVPLEPA